MPKVTITDLMEAGVHFGHQTKRWNPKMKEFVYGAKNGISIIDLTKTMRQIADACNFLQRKVAGGGQVLFVGTKRQAQQLIKECAEQTGMFYVSERWLGGTLTNNVTIKKSIARMQEIDKVLGADEAKGMKKKELSAMSRNGVKLHRDLDGIASMKRLPDVLVVIDVCKEEIAVKEANKLKIPIVALVDTNGNPDSIDYPVAANDDAVRSVKIIMELFVDAIKTAAEIYQKKALEDKARIEAEREAAAKERAEKAAKAKAEKAEKEAAAKAARAAAPKVEKKKEPAAEAAAEAAPEAEKAADKGEEKKPAAKAAKAAPAKKAAAPKTEKAADKGEEKKPAAKKAPAKKAAPKAEK